MIRGELEELVTEVVVVDLGVCPPAAGDVLAHNVKDGAVVGIAPLGHDPAALVVDACLATLNALANVKRPPHLRGPLKTYET